MKIYGTGQLTAHGSSRVIWDFVDGPFDCSNPALIDEARRRGYSFSPPAITEIREPVKATIEQPKDTPKKRGRKPKEVANVNS